MALNGFDDGSFNHGPLKEVSKSNITSEELAGDVEAFLAQGGKVTLEAPQQAVPWHEARDYIKANRDKLMEPLNKPYDITSKGYTK
ncbi:MAG: hypothetical protein COB09_18455 [Thalassobium sp.]|nr:MAG: hypothetical protein COB09_18455 [Thalassobium sp.]